MKRLIALGALSLASFAALWGSGIAASAGVPDVTGQKYGDAQGTLSDAGFTPVVSTTVGDREPWSDCVVVNAVERPMLEVVMQRADGNQSRAAEWLGINRNTLRRKLLEHKLIK